LNIQWTLEIWTAMLHPPAAFDLFFIKNRFEIASSNDEAALAGVSFSHRG